ncbi:AraC-like DNA-binding protein [Paenibacillus castaneae]|uniref:AraC family transcriptional regulator n=1 Tax=Paenibacillus castaneae TaxID=474957 RepID=UPI000C9CCB18|nr:AraC family transcriptional regulator [Paenibacillus castaneae]NIK80327.1 AraC-like DNA-binding protein [Paenibacillus castaneae]
MKPTIDSILINQLNHIHVEVLMTAYMESLPGWSVPKSEPEFYRFCYMDKGQGWIEINNVRQAIQPNTLYFLPAGTAQTFGTEGDEVFGRYWCNFRFELFDIEFIHSLQLPLFVYVKDEQMIKQLFSKMLTYQNCTSVTRELRLKAVLLEMISFYLDESKFQQHSLSEASLGVKWNEVLAYIESNLHTNIQIEELAKVAFLHPNYFISSFKSRMGCSPIQYVTNRRIAKAKELLAETSLSIASVANHVGMQNHYLSRLFKRYTGITPIQYRRISKQGAGNMPEYSLIKTEEESS